VCVCVCHGVCVFACERERERADDSRKRAYQPKEKKRKESLIYEASSITSHVGAPLPLTKQGELMLH
jgi:hypothetical protein